MWESLTQKRDSKLFSVGLTFVSSSLSHSTAPIEYYQKFSGHISHGCSSRTKISQVSCIFNITAMVVDKMDVDAILILELKGFHFTLVDKMTEAA